MPSRLPGIHVFANGEGANFVDRPKRGHDSHIFRLWAQQ